MLMTQTHFANPSVAMTRPADTTAYASGDLVANDVDAGDVVPLAFSTRTPNVKNSGKIIGVTLRKTTNTTTAATFRLHLFDRTKAPTNGDNADIAIANMEGFIGSVDIDMSSGTNAGLVSNEIFKHISLSAAPLCFKNTAEDLRVFGLLEARGAYAPGSAEVFTTTLHIEV